MSRRTEIARVSDVRLETIFENLALPVEKIEQLSDDAEIRTIGDISVERAITYLSQHPAIFKISETKRFSKADMLGKDLRIKFNHGAYAVGSVNIQIKSGMRDIGKFREDIRGYLRRHGLANPTEEDIDKHLARKRLLVLNPRSGYVKFMASFEEQIERICDLASSVSYKQ